jgi:hypothetical protein
MKHPEYNPAHFTVWALPHPFVLHWVINPGLAFNELILGQRLPKVILIDNRSDKPLFERTYVPCPQCGTLHDSRLWGKWNAFGHWFGFLCPTCDKMIPCIWNIFSLLILVATSPLWFLPVRYLRPTWLQYEKRRLARRAALPLIEANKINCFLLGTFMFGGIGWLAMSVAPQALRALKGHEMVWRTIWIQLPVWLLAGLTWGTVMYFWMNKKANNRSSR